jgi:hypothetical protein
MGREMITELRIKAVKAYKSSWELLDETNSICQKELVPVLYLEATKQHKHLM